MLIGTATNKINLWINSLSIVKDATADESIINEGARKQWATHNKDNDTAALSLLNCDLIDIFLFTLIMRFHAGD